MNADLNDFKTSRVKNASKSVLRKKKELNDFKSFEEYAEKMTKEDSELLRKYYSKVMMAKYSAE